jgi:hypothetical protein
VSLTSYALGVGTTVVGSWIASKFHLYQQARSAHHVELRESVLVPIRTALQGQFYDPLFELKWVTKKFNVDARCQDDPILSGLELHGPPAIDPSQFGDAVLYQDAAERHYADLLRSWKHFVHSWNIHVTERKEWIQGIADSIFRESKLPLGDSGTAGRYILPIHLALLVSNRLRRRTTPTLSIRPTQPLVSFGDSLSSTYAAGEPHEIETLQNLINVMLASESSERARAERLDLDLGRFEASRAALEHKFTDAITWKILPHGCRRVSFFSLLTSL